MTNRPLRPNRLHVRMVVTDRHPGRAGLLLRCFIALSRFCKHLSPNRYSTDLDIGLADPSSF
jgi:hypothetical protein